MKAIFAGDRSIPRALDPLGLAETFTFWTDVPPQAVFAGVTELEPGPRPDRRARPSEDRRVLGAPLPGRRGDELPGHARRGGGARARARSRRPSRLRMLRADVPVGSYLSGGLDSSLVAALGPPGQGRPVLHLLDPLRGRGVRRDAVPADDGRAPRERPPRDHGRSPRHRRASSPRSSATRSARCCGRRPAPLFLLSRLVRESGIKVVLTGEGADEMFAGYDLFREAKVRRFWGRQPASTIRPRLLDRLYPYLARSPVAQRTMARAVLRPGPRAVGGARVRPPDALAARGGAPATLLGRTCGARRAGSTSPARAARRAPRRVRPLAAPRPGPVPGGAHAALRVPPLVAGRPDAHGPLGRGPVPLPRRRGRGAGELPARRPTSCAGSTRSTSSSAPRRAWFPTRSSARPKQPYRAPDAPRSRGRTRPDWVAEVMSERAVADAGVFDPDGGRPPVAQVPEPAERRAVLERRQHGARRRPVHRTALRAARSPRADRSATMPFQTVVDRLPIRTEATPRAQAPGRYYRHDGRGARAELRPRVTST